MLSIPTPVLVALGLCAVLGNNQSHELFLGRSRAGVSADWSCQLRLESGNVLLSPLREAGDKDRRDEQRGCVFCSWRLSEVAFLVVLLNVFLKAK